MTESLSQHLKDRFDRVFETVTTGSTGFIQDFSAQVIIRDLVVNGVSVYDSLDILERIRPNLKPRIHTDKITKLVNQTLLEMGYTQDNFLNGDLIDDTTILYPDGHKERLSYRFVKNYVNELLSEFHLSSKTFRSIVEEYHRILRGLDASEITISTVEQLRSLILKNVLNIDPWNRSDSIDQYNYLIKQKAYYMRLKGLRTREEDIQALVKLYQISLNLILLSNGYLPGLSIGSTTGLIEKLISKIHTSTSSGLSSRDIHLVGRLSNLLDRYIHFVDSDTARMGIEEELSSGLDHLLDLVKLVLDRGIISWFFVMSDGGIELFSTQDGKNTSQVGLLVAAGMSGVEKLVEEITENHPQLIKHEEGVIILEKRRGYSVVVLAKLESPSIIQSVEKFCNLVDANLLGRLLNFNGNVSSLHGDFMSYFHQAKLHYLFS